MEDCHLYKNRFKGGIVKVYSTKLVDPRTENDREKTNRGEVPRISEQLFHLWHKRIYPINKKIWPFLQNISIPFQIFEVVEVVEIK